MLRHTGLGRAVGILVTFASALLAVIPAPARAQHDQQDRSGAVEQWAEIITVTKDWLVLRNAQGQEFPVSVDAIALFVMRWPTSPERLSPTVLLEATGVDNGSYQLATNQVDVYDGAARSLVTPGLLYIGGSGRTERPIDFTFNAQAYGEPFPGIGTPIQGGVPTGPQMLHVVGPLLSRTPLVIHVVEGNNAVVVQPLSPAGFNMTQVTQGNVALVRPGDIAFFAAMEARPKSLILEQLVVYKSIPLDQFNP